MDSEPDYASTKIKSNLTDGRWMLKLVYPHATSLEAYLGQWLRDMVTILPGSVAVNTINSAGGPLRYLVRQDDGVEFNQVSKDPLSKMKIDAANGRFDIRVLS